MRETIRARIMHTLTYAEEWMTTSDVAAAAGGTFGYVARVLGELRRARRVRSRVSDAGGTTWSAST